MELDGGSPLLMKRFEGINWNRRSTILGTSELIRILRRGIRKTKKFIAEKSNLDTLDINETDMAGQNIFHLSVQREELLQFLLETFKNHVQFKECLQMEEARGHTPAHLAVLLNERKSFQMLSKFYENIAEICSRLSGKWLVHCAVESDHEYMIEDVLELRPNAIFDKDKDGKLPIHYAAELPENVILEMFLGFGVDIMETDNNGYTALHFAVESGSMSNVQLLLAYNIELILPANKREQTALHIACNHGYGDIVAVLLEHGADPFPRDEKGDTALDCAVKNKSYTATEQLLRTPSWKELVSEFKGGGKNCFVHLTNHMPNAAKILLDRCYERSASEVDPNSESYQEAYDFSFLEPTATNYPPKYESLYAILDERKGRCLTHPVTRKFLSVKWRRNGFKIYTANLIVYLIFHIVFNVYILLLREQAVRNAEKDSTSAVEERKFFRLPTSDSTVESSIDELNLDVMSDTYAASNSTGAMVVFVVSCTILNIIKELCQIYLTGWKYFRQMTNYFEWVLYMCVMVFMFPVRSRKSFTQYFAGSIAVFFTWFNLIWFMRRLPALGTYILLLEKVFMTVLKMLSIIGLFCLAFASTFHLLLAEFSRYHDFRIAVVSTFVSMFGDFDYDDSFVVRENDGFIYSFKLFVFVIFLLLMAIVVNNVLIGLAVGDTDSVMKQATLQNLRQQVKFIIEIDSSLSGRLPWFRRTNVTTYVEYPDHSNSMLKKIRSLLFGEWIATNEHEEGEEDDGVLSKEDVHEIVDTIVKTEIGKHRKEMTRQLREFREDLFGDIKE